MKTKNITCDPACGFSVHSHDEKELVRFAKDHVKHAHHSNLSDSDAKAMIKS